MVKEPINPEDFWRDNNCASERRCYPALFIREKLNEAIPDNEETEDDTTVMRFRCLSHSPQSQLALFLMVKEPINPGDFWRGNNCASERRCYSALFIREKPNETITDNEETEDDTDVKRFRCLWHSPESQLGWEPFLMCVPDSGCFLIRRS
ncbi:hypothetical protein CDAR_72471 [Caerostris darwini]|uniref:Uncharacterized protein n=1 Tax=Caerostris darwini TaxID=1538125 RepID=A0AAV4MN06_9ARAC|nr:hypothetical protein CDAR_72471 [Caerostris darwini]